MIPCFTTITKTLFTAGVLFGMLACGQQPGARKEATDPPARSFPYALDKPQRFTLPRILNEISGISFRNGLSDTVYAEQDELGTLFRFRPGGPSMVETRFGKKGDYEDIQVGNEEVFVLRSDGVISRFPMPGGAERVEAQTIEGILPSGEYEGMYLDAASNKLYVLCKHCDEKPHKTNTGYIFSTAGGQLQPAGSFILSVEVIAGKAGKKKLDFAPSALAWNGRLKQWFIISSVNKLLVVAGPDWTVQDSYPLDPGLYNQPEGIAFDQAGNLYISNEKGGSPAATLLKITYHPAP
ncbi:MAG: SdiA-regulated family protein [Williamsia sp.]|nr:SdiA-regulated family protein [Williamsia sp.]